MCIWQSEEFSIMQEDLFNISSNCLPIREVTQCNLNSYVSSREKKECVTGRVHVANMKMIDVRSVSTSLHYMPKKMHDIN